MNDSQSQISNKSRIYNIDFSKEISFINNNSLSEIKNNNSSIFFSSPLFSLLSKIKTPNIHYFCKNCSNFPSIEFINFTEVYIKCACLNSKKRKMFIEEFLDPKKSNIIFLNNNIVEENNDIIDKLNNNKKYNLKCYMHENKHKFRFYCIECLKNICKECCQEHLGDSHNLITFDFENCEAKKKVIEIQKMLNLLQKKIEDNLLNDDIKGFLFENNSKNSFMKKPKIYLENFIKLCNIIILDYSKYPNYSHFYNIENIYRFLIKQLKNAVCKIIINNNYETGFFCEQNYGHENNNFHFLVTTNHIIGKGNNNIIIQLPNMEDSCGISFNDSERKVYKCEEKDIFFLEIKNEDFPIKLNYLSIDETININSLDNNYKQIFLLHNYQNEIKLDTGTIYAHKGENLEHNCHANGINSIGGALLSKDYKVIGINIGKNHMGNNFTGLFLKPFFDKFNPIKYENNSQFKKISFLNKYEVNEEIGHGEYGHVYKGKNKTTGELIAIKIINKKKIKDYIRNFYDDKNNKVKLREIDIILNDYIDNMKILSNENSNIFLKYFEFFQEKSEDREDLIIITELCDDNLYNYLLKQKRSFNAEEIYRIIQNLNIGFKKMNEKKIIHGNLKLENILIKYLDENKTKYIFKICDYGSNIIISDFLKNGEKSILEYCRTNYVLLENKNKNLLVDFFSKYIPKTMYPHIDKIEKEKEKDIFDLWSLGIMIYQLFFEEIPFEINSEKHSIIKKTKNIQLDDLIKSLLKQKISKWKDYFKHDFCECNIFLLNSININEQNF